jgi:hypothetical protein
MTTVGVGRGARICVSGAEEREQEGAIGLTMSFGSKQRIPDIFVPIDG